MSRHDWWSTIRLGTGILALACWGMTASVAGAANSPSDLQPDSASAQLSVWPEEIRVTPWYPARIGVALVAADGTQIDLSRDEGVQRTVADPEIASVDSDGWVVAEGIGTTKLRVTWGEHSVERSVRAIEEPDASPSFTREISAVLGKSGCNLGTCHGNLHGKAGFRLSLRGDDPWLDYRSITRSAGGRRIDWFSSEESLILNKPTGRLAHQGGVRLPPDSIGYQWLKVWIEAGAPWNPESEESRVAPESGRESESSPVEKSKSSPVELSVWPKTAWIAPGNRRQQLVVTARWPDGTRRDVTQWARYELSVVSGAEVGADALVEAERPIDLAVSVFYLGRYATSRLIFLDRERSTIASSPPPSQIDRLIEKRLDKMRIEPLESASDGLWLRRLYLVTCGRLPTVDELNRFMSSDHPAKRDRWIDRALSDRGYDAMWALHWSDLIRNESRVMSRRGSFLLNRWLRDQFAVDLPLNKIAADLVKTVGSTYEHPAASFHRTHRDPKIAAESIGQVFLGVRLQCARCHNHPFDVWKQDDYYGLAAYFSTIERKQIDNNPRDDLDKHVITGDEIISLDDRRARIFHPGLSRMVSPSPLGRTAKDHATGDAPESELSSEATPLDELADWLTRGNRMFARNWANRIWFQLMGRGIVDPPDDFRISNPPSNPELLDYLTDELIRSGYSTRHLCRQILRSRAFARKGISQQAASAGEALPGAPVFAGYPLHRMPAEVLLDAIGDVTGVADRLDYTWDDGQRKGGDIGVVRAVEFPGVPRRDSFLRAFGKPERLLVCECERNNDASLIQAFLLLNGSDCRRMITSPGNRIDELLNEGTEPKAMLHHFYLAALARRPSEAEGRKLLDYIDAESDRRSAWEDVVWALLNSKEFQLVR